MLTPSGCALSWPESTFEWPARKKRERYTMKKRKKKKKWILTLETREPVNKLSALLVLVFLRRY